MINEDQIKQWVKEGGRKKPGKDFVNTIMSQVEIKPSTTFTYQPVISTKGVRMIVGAMVLVFALAILLSSGTETNPMWLKALDNLRDFNTSILNTRWTISLDLPLKTFSPIYGYSLIIFSGALFIIGRLDALARN